MYSDLRSHALSNVKKSLTTKWKLSRRMKGPGFLFGLLLSRCACFPCPKANDGWIDVRARRAVEVWPTRVGPGRKRAVHWRLSASLPSGATEASFGAHPGAGFV
jgi:hypothetical protein